MGREFFVPVGTLIEAGELRATFLAIKRCMRTNIKKVIKIAQSSSKSWAHICAHKGKALNKANCCFYSLPPSRASIRCTQQVDIDGASNIDLPCLCL